MNKRKTTLWYVGQGEDVIYVTDEQDKLPPCEHVLRIRTISANAAGRRYFKFNLPDNLAKADNLSNFTMKPGIVKGYKKAAAHFTIQVIK